MAGQAQNYSCDTVRLTRLSKNPILRGPTDAIDGYTKRGLHRKHFPFLHGAGKAIVSLGLSLWRYPLGVRTDNGPEFTSAVFMAWAQTHRIRHILIEPGRPMQNGYIESFNGKFRDECLNEHWFETLHQARTAIGIWRQD